MSRVPRPVRSSSVTELTVDGITTLYHGSLVHRLDAIGTVVWHCLDGARPLERLIDDLAEVYDVDRDRVAGDVESLIDDLAERGLVDLHRRSAAPTSPRPSSRTEDGEGGVPLIAYAVPGMAPMTLEPAAARRGWMDATDQRFANRCLPLLMANQAGWVVRNPMTVLVTWDGGNGLENLAVEPLRGDGPCPAVSHFGYGILTWTIPYLFRTPEGYNLLLRGPANEPKDGAHPLEGIVETDWATATATMNWKLTRPGLTVRFDVGDAVCMVVPQRRGELEAFQPRTEPLSANAELAEAHQVWRESRSAFNRGLASGESLKGPGNWQKHYFHGASADGGKAPQHQRHMRLRPFTSSD